MKRKFIIFFLICSYNLIGQDIPIPSHYSIIESVKGDLDKDGIEELVVAYNCEAINETNESVSRELIIYKKNNNQWVVWEKSKNALLESQDGGMMGDPFSGIEIKNNVLSISHNGGSRWKWGYTEKYRYQNQTFYLIGYSTNSGAPCEYWLNVDYNLSTGKIIVAKEYEDCESAKQEIYKTEKETFYKKGLKITLQNRSSKEIQIISPKYKFEIYLF